MYEDGAGRKVQRLNRLVQFVRSRSSQGVTIAHVKTFAERHLGLSPKRTEAYLRLLERTRELREVDGKLFIRDDK